MRPYGLDMDLVAPALVFTLRQQVRVPTVLQNVSEGYANSVLNWWRWLGELSVPQQTLSILCQNTKIRHFWKYLIFREQRRESASFTRAKDTVWVVEQRGTSDCGWQSLNSTSDHACVKCRVSNGVVGVFQRAKT